MFSSQSDNCTPFVHIFDIIFFFAAEMEEPKIGISDKGLTLVLSALKAFADDKLRDAHSSGLFCERAEKIRGKGENVGNQLFLHFPRFLPLAKVNSNF